MGYKYQNMIKIVMTWNFELDRCQIVNEYGGSSILCKEERDEEKSAAILFCYQFLFYVFLRNQRDECPVPLGLAFQFQQPFLGIHTELKATQLAILLDDSVAGH